MYVDNLGSLHNSLPSFLSSACLLPLSATVCGGAIHMTPLSIPSHLVHTNRDSQHDTVSIHYHNRPVYPAPLLTLRHTVFNRDVSGILYCYVHSTLWKAAAYLLHTITLPTEHNITLSEIRTLPFC